MPLVESAQPSADDIFFTSEELAIRWRLDPATLDNQRSRGDGIPYVKLQESRRVLYRMSDVLRAERDGAKGFSWAKLRTALDCYPHLDSKATDKLFAWLKKELD